jgi:hypothetical protein
MRKCECARLLSDHATYLFGAFHIFERSRIFHRDVFICGIKGQNDFSALRRRNVKKYLAILVWRARDKGAKGPFFCGWARSSLVFYFSTDRTAVNILFIMLHLRSIPRHIYVCMYMYFCDRDRVCDVWCALLGPQTPLLFRACKNAHECTIEYCAGSKMNRDALILSRIVSAINFATITPANNYIAVIFRMTSPGTTV